MFCSRKRLLKLEKRGENGASKKERVFLLSLIFLRHNKDGGYNSTNINKQLSPAQNTPALQATPKLDMFSSNGVEFIELAKCAIFSTSCDCAISCDTRAHFLRGRRAKDEETKWRRKLPPSGAHQMGKALDNIDLNQMSHRYVSGVSQNDWNDPVDFPSLDRSQRRCYISVGLSYKTVNIVVSRSYR